MAKYVVIFSTSVTLIDASSERQAVNRYLNKILKLSDYSKEDNEVQNIFARKIRVHELDDGQEYEIEGKIEARVSEVNT